MSKDFLVWGFKRLLVIFCLVFTEYVLSLQCGSVPSVPSSQANQTSPAGLHHTSASVDISTVFQGESLYPFISFNFSLSLYHSSLDLSPCALCTPSLSLSLIMISFYNLSEQYSCLSKYEKTGFTWYYTVN